MKYTLTEKLLLLIADYEDFYQASFSIKRAIPYVLGAPSLHKHRMWMEKYLEDKKKRKRLNDVLYMLYRRKILKRVFKDKRAGYILNDEGRLKIMTVRLKEMKKKRLSQKQWLMVFFDIPESLRKRRDQFRIILKILGFENFQKSIWITSYDVRKEVKEAIKNLGISKFTELLIVKKFESV